MDMPVYFRVATPIGEMRIYVADGRPELITLPGSDVLGKEAVSTPPVDVARLIEALEAYFHGREAPARFAESLIANLNATPFERAVLAQVARIPRGETRSYGEVAELAGYARAARAVGNVMHDNPFPIVIPCHRVIKGDGSIGGYGGAEDTKAWLLSFEGWEPKR
jgi:methylated-DNA-[protein]-cysteine S-methyltransferase